MQIARSRRVSPVPVPWVARLGLSLGLILGQAGAALAALPTVPEGFRIRLLASVPAEDAEARRIKITRGEIDERKSSDVSIMPNGLAESLGRQDFADLIAYLATLKEAPNARPAPGGGDGRDRR